MPEVLHVFTSDTSCFPSGGPLFFLVFCFVFPPSLFFSYILVWCTIHLKHGCLYSCFVFNLFIYLFIEFVLKRKKLALRPSPLVLLSGLDGESLVALQPQLQKWTHFFRNFDQTLSISGSTGGEKKPQNNTVNVVLLVFVFFCFVFFFPPLVNLNFVHPH